MVICKKRITRRLGTDQSALHARYSKRAKTKTSIVTLLLMRAEGHG